MQITLRAEARVGKRNAETDEFRICIIVLYYSFTVSSTEGCIEPSGGPYSAPLVLVRKKEGELCVCVDYRNMEKNTIPDQFPMP